MEISPLFFGLFAGLSVAFSLAVVLKRNPVSSAFALVMVFFSFAGIYALLDAHLIATLQILVYAGAIMVLFIFVIMLLNADVDSFDLGRSHLALRAAAVLTASLVLVMLVWALRESPSAPLSGPMTAEKVAELGGNTKVISTLMFSDYLLPFELTSVLLLAAIIGAVAVAKRHRTSGSPTQPARKS
jgi:NADH-quinone oxidoreductase subunit J